MTEYKPESSVCYSVHFVVVVTMLIARRKTLKNFVPIASAVINTCLIYSWWYQLFRSITDVTSQRLFPFLEDLSYFPCALLSTSLYLNNFLEVSSSGFRKPGPGKTSAVRDSYLDFRRRGEVSGGRQGSFHQVGVRKRFFRDTIFNKI